jgi:hypothetical protein
MSIGLAILEASKHHLRFDNIGNKQPICLMITLAQRKK